jgi:hypothetical protein
MPSKLGVNLENRHPIIVRYDGNLSNHNMKHHKLTQIGKSNKLYLKPMFYGEMKT